MLIGKPKPVLPRVDERSAAMKFLDAHDQMSSDLDTLRKENISQQSLVASLMSEVTMLKEALERSEKAFKTLQAYSVKITTKLEIISQTIEGVMKDAASHRVEPVPDAEKKDDKDLSDIIARITPAVLDQKP